MADHFGALVILPTAFRSGSTIAAEAGNRAGGPLLSRGLGTDRGQALGCPRNSRSAIGREAEGRTRAAPASLPACPPHRPTRWPGGSNRGCRVALPSARMRGRAARPRAADRAAARRRSPPSAHRDGRRSRSASPRACPTGDDDLAANVEPAIIVEARARRRTGRSRRTPARRRARGLSSRSGGGRGRIR